ncbi:MAG TPA: alpha-L-arabinofuranosidase C-terminal domain-containing protein [Candidatus Hydrogenedentes bacterium]|nr:alpha-L-arabinofuranosidase C-terminal domain-containing protein [Candidatus Hydrogenedentota bacterium]
MMQNFLLLAALAMTGQQPDSSPQAVVHLDAAKRLAPVSRNLFGVFTEHLYTNVYQGAWAQIVHNPEFAPFHRWPRSVYRKPILSGEARTFGLPDEAAAYKEGIAAQWARCGKVTGEIVCTGKSDYQRLMLAEPEAGLESGLYPPLHRVKHFILTLKARSETPMTARCYLRSVDGQPLGEVAFALTSEWTQADKTLRVAKPEGFPAGSPCVLGIRFESAGVVELDRALLFPGDHVEGWEPEVVACMKQAHIAMLRFPGGNFVSGYDWRDGVGPLDNRPTLPNPAWDEVEWNHVGIEEWMTLCRLTGAEPLMCVNAGDGSPEMARQLVEYCNGPASTEWGAKRAANGHSEPYGIRYWEVGNELWGGWQVGHATATTYAERYKTFREAMRNADPSILLIANGGDRQEWNRTLIEANGANVRSLSLHTLQAWGTPADADPARLHDELMAFAHGYDAYAGMMAAPMAEAGLVPRIAVTELMILRDKGGEPNYATQSESLFTAGVYHAAMRSNGLIEIITHSALLNHGGGLRKEHSVVYANPVWHAIHLYGSQPGTIPTPAETTAPTIETKGEWIGAPASCPALDVMGLLDENGKTWSIFVINYDREQSLRAELTIDGFPARAKTEGAVVAGDAFTAKNTFQKPTAIGIKTFAAELRDGRIRHAFPPVSITRFTLHRK